ncbi:hypothetical protein JVT61DRAFT_7186 [Boletus reticuloceps]|uniref:Uncharacterized protein n=1 Tax=Boletus reticuloceps TaxID=495285 RepID=A0A8I3A793_9AGAM|nr:hypothetical protein JVT61DRAFT_7186 [Boletus reticuloceps]
MHVHYGRLPPTTIKERVEEMGHMTSTILFTTLDLGVVIVRIAGIFALSETPVLATGLVFTSTVPWIVPLLTFSITTLNSKGSYILGDGAGIESGDVVEEAGD